MVPGNTLPHTWIVPLGLVEQSRLRRKSTLDSTKASMTNARRRNKHNSKKNRELAWENWFPRAVPITNTGGMGGARGAPSVTLT